MRRSLVRPAGIVVLVFVLFAPTFHFSAFAQVPLLTIGAVQGQVLDTSNGRTQASPLVGQFVRVRGVIYQRVIERTSTGGSRRSFFIQNTAATADGDPLTSDGIFVFVNFPTTIPVDTGGTYTPTVGDEVIIEGRVAEFFNVTELTGPRRIGPVLQSGVNLDTALPAYEANPPSLLADADRYWERREGMRGRVPAGSIVVGGRDFFASSLDGEVWVIRADNPVAQRSNVFARHVFRDPHPLDNNAGQLFDDGNGFRILMGSLGLKGTANDNTVLINPARFLDTLANAPVGGTHFAFAKYSIQVGEQPTFTPGADPAGNAPPPAFDRLLQYTVATFNVENLYDFRDDPFDTCDFNGGANVGCLPTVRPPFDYAPASQAEYDRKLSELADQIRVDLRSPDIIMAQEVEDQDLCTVVGAALSCNLGVNNADGRPDALQELALLIAARGGPVYEAAYDRDGADDRGIVNGYLFRTERVQLLPAASSDPVFGASPQVVYRASGLAYNADVQNPKALNAVLPADVDLSTGFDGTNVFTRAPQVARFRLWRAGINVSAVTDILLLNNHFSSTPDARVGQRKEQAGYNAAIVAVLQRDPRAHVVVGGDLNVFPRPDDPFSPGHPRYPSDQLAALYDFGLANLYDRILVEQPANAYSFIFQGQAQTLDMHFVNAVLNVYVVQARGAHINSDFPGGYDGDGPRGAADHDPQVARFWAATPDGLAGLVRYLRSTGAISREQTAEILADRAVRAARFLGSSQRPAYRDQLQAFISQVDDFTPQFITTGAANLLKGEANLLLTSGP